MSKKTDTYKRTQRLLYKYKTRHPMEKWSTESYTKESKEKRTNEYLQMSIYYMDRMKLVGNQRRDLQWIIKNIPLYELHKRASAENIILSLCIYIRKSYNKKFRWQEYGIIKETGLDCNTILTVVTNLCIWYSKKVPLPRADNVDKHGTLTDDYSV